MRLPAVPIRLRVLAGAGLALVLPVMLPAPAAAIENPGAFLGARSAERAGDARMAAELYGRAAAADPGNPDLLARAMFHSVSAGDVADALPFAERLGPLDPRNRYRTLLLAVEEIRAGAFPTAIARLDAERDEVGALFHGLLKGWSLSVDDLAAADAAFDGLGATDGLKAIGAYHRALAHAVAGDPETAARILEAEMPDAFSGDRRALRGRAEILAATGRQARALEAIDLALSRGLTDPELSALRARIAAGEPVSFALVPDATAGSAEALHTLGLLLGAREQSRSFAIFVLQLALHLRPDNPEARFALADHFQAEGQHELAIAVLDAVPEASPNHVEAETERAGALIGAGRTEAGIAALESLTRAHPEALRPAAALAGALRRAERFGECAEAYGRAIALLGPEQPRHWGYFYERGICHERSGMWDPAEADFRKALALDPGQPLVLNYLGYSLVELGRNLPEAEDMIRRAVTARPDDGYIVDSLAWVLYRLGRYEEAVAPMERAVALVPSDPILNDHLGDVLWMVGRRLEARFQWRRALSFGPEEKEIGRIRRKLEVGLDRVREEEAAQGKAPSPGDGG